MYLKLKSYNTISIYAIALTYLYTLSVGNIIIG